MEATDLLQNVVQTMMEGVAIADRWGRVVFANSALEQLLGYEAGKLTGLHWAALFAEPSCSWHFGLSGAMAGRYEARLRHKNGTAIPVLISSRLLQEGSDRQGILATFSDLRPGSEPPAQLAELNELPVTPYVSSVVHELKNSLTILLLQSQILSRGGGQTPQFEESLSIIQGQARRMKQMLDDLRSPAEPHQLRLEPIDVNDLVENTLCLLKHHLQAEGIEVSLHLGADLPILRVDPYKLQQVFVNLINNARHAIATENRDGKLVITTALVPGEDGGDAVIRIQFADNGPGIAPDVMPHIFRPFFTTKTPEEGMGLGLSICEQIVARHSGRIWAENNELGGGTLMLELPVLEPSAEKPPPLPPADPGQYHLLVVDDDAQVAHLMGHLLRSAGFCVTTTTTARRALALLKEVEIDLILSDLGMPHMDGMQFWQAVVEQHPHLSQRIIFSSGDSSGSGKQALFQESGCVCVEKPFQPEVLLRLIWEKLTPG
jgi:two-component system NtrC family sensor kinase